MPIASHNFHFSQASSLVFSHYRAPWLFPLDLSELKQIVGILQRSFQPDGLEVHLVNDCAIAQMNLQYMGCVGPTNVLSFPGAKGMPGTLVISLDCVAREAILYAQKPQIHFLRLLAHGFGHLAGHDHGVELETIEKKCFELSLKLYMKFEPQGSGQWG